MALREWSLAVHRTRLGLAIANPAPTSSSPGPLVCSNGSEFQAFRTEGKGEKKSQDLIRHFARLQPIERNKNLTSRGHFPQIVEFRCIIAADRNLTVCYHDAKLVTILPAALVADPIAESVP